MVLKMGQKRGESNRVRAKIRQVCPIIIVVGQPPPPPLRPHGFAPRHKRIQKMRTQCRCTPVLEYLNNLWGLGTEQE
jgi:hypothetical protein